MNGKTKKDDLLDMFNSKINDLSVNEIKVLIDQELRKKEDEIDMEYIDFCYELIKTKENSPIPTDNQIKRRKKIRPSRIMIAAAIMLILTVASVTVYAYVVDFNIPQYIAQLIEGNAEIDPNLENADTTADGYELTDTDLAKQLAEYGISPVTFPEELIEECSIISIENLTADESIQKDVYICFEYLGAAGSLSVSQSSAEYEKVGEETIMEIVSAEMIHVNGMDIMIFEQEKTCSIIYKDRLTKYSISIECDMETALKFAESIK